MNKHLLLLSPLLIVFLITKLFAQSGSLPVQNDPMQVLSSNCTGGLVYDDNSFENEYAVVCSGYGWKRWVMKFTPLSYPYSINKICIALTRLTNTANWSFNIDVFDTTGYGGVPGTLIDSIVGVTATNIGIWPNVTWHEFSNITGIPTLYNGSYYIGISYDPCATIAIFGIGADESPASSRHTGFDWRGGEWVVIQSHYTNYRALGIRAEQVITGVSGNSNEIPKVFRLYNNYPNPFNPTSTIRYDLPNAVDVKMIVFNTLGQEITTLVNEQYQAGSYTVLWDGTNYPSGVYFYKIVAGNYTDTKKMLLVK